MRVMNLINGEISGVSYDGPTDKLLIVGTTTGSTYLGTTQRLLKIPSGTPVKIFRHSGNTISLEINDDLPEQPKTV